MKRLGLQLTVGADLSLPQVQGPRPLPVRVLNTYVNRVQTAAERDPVVAEQFLRIAGLGPTRATVPATTVQRVLLGNLPRPRQAAIDPATRVPVVGPRA